jgi:N-acetylglucosaminyldiphosphoundecaprenol N-acetyl-beta-D-mannosaminyltransferase
MKAPDVPRYNVLGVGVSALTFRQAVDLVIGERGGGDRGYVCLCTANGLAEARRDPGYRKIFNGSFLTTADGMPTVWLGPKGSERVYGPDLMLAVCDAGRAHGLKHFFYGGGPGVAQTLAARLADRYPGLVIAGSWSPPFGELGEEELVLLRAAVAESRPDVFWVGLGTPKQERFMAGLGSTLGAGLMIGVGAAFDIHSGRLAQAPRWMRRCGLEWLFRLAVEPRRLAGRYTVTNTLFVARVAAQKLGLRRYPID